MSIRTLCLAILNGGEATGYEIKKLSIEGRYRYFAEASFGSIYPTLSRLESEGLVTVREEVHPGKPSRKVYAITLAGRSALVAALSEPPEADVWRSSFLLVATNAEILPVRVVRAALDARLATLSQEIEQLREIARSTPEPATRWAADYGVACLTTSVGYLESRRDTLEALAIRPDVAAPLLQARG